MMMPGFGFLVLLVADGAVLALALGGTESLRRVGTDCSANERRPTPRELVDQRLARGEIDQDEYQAIRARLEG
jgi:uncharacterized membrane protein